MNSSRANASSDSSASGWRGRSRASSRPPTPNDFFDEILHADQCRESDVRACIAGCIVAAGFA